MFEVIKWDWSSLEFAVKELLADRKFILEAMKWSPWSLAFSAEEL